MISAVWHHIGSRGCLCPDPALSLPGLPQHQHQWTGHFTHHCWTHHFPGVILWMLRCRQRELLYGSNSKL